MMYRINTVLAPEDDLILVWLVIKKPRDIAVRAFFSLFSKVGLDQPDAVTLDDDQPLLKQATNGFLKRAFTHAELRVNQLR